jgi:glycosyltransferase involved in cell wall biosynthesis
VSKDGANEVSSSDMASRRNRLDYLCLQPTREGQASHAHVYEIIAGLRRRGWDVHLIEPSLPRPGRLDGVRRAFAAATVQLSYWVRSGFRPAPVVYIRSHFLALPTAALAKFRGVTVVQEVNGPSGDTYDAWPKLRYVRPLISLSSLAQLKWADAVITVTQGLADHLAEVTGRRGVYYVVGNGADVDMFTPLGGDAQTDDRPYVVFVGALASWQGIDVVLDSTRDPAWPKEVDLVIAGDGKERPMVEEAARKDNRIHWLGVIPYRDSPRLVAKSLASLVPMVDVPRSKFGLSPLKLFEAMACGVPVVAADLPGLVDIVRVHDCGVTFPAGDSAALARAVSGLFREPQQAREMGRRGREAAVEMYSWDARAGQTHDVLLQRRAAGRSRREADVSPSRSGP